MKAETQPERPVRGVPVPSIYHHSTYRTTCQVVTSNTLLWCHSPFLSPVHARLLIHIGGGEAIYRYTIKHLVSLPETSDTRSQHQLAALDTCQLAAAGPHPPPATLMYESPLPIPHWCQPGRIPLSPRSMGWQAVLDSTTRRALRRCAIHTPPAATPMQRTPSPQNQPAHARSAYLPSAHTEVP